jgi:predicted small lipoprotein YifL
LVVRRVLVSLLAVAALAACGRKLDPLPPLIEVPETTTDLTAGQVEDRVVLSWSYPGMTRSGRQLTDLGQIEVWRLAVPPGQEAPEEMRRQIVLGRGEVIARLRKEELHAATRGPRLELTDPLPAPAAGVPSTLWYAVRTRRQDGTPSALSNVAAVSPRPAPAAPQGLRAAPEAGGIRLSWDEVQGAAYLVERRPADEEEWVAMPEPLPQATILDSGAAQGRSWLYRVRAVADGVRGPAGDTVRVDYRDIYPPPPVAALICLPEANNVRLVWESVDEPGVIYRVFRQQPGRRWIRLHEGATELAFADEDPPVGPLTYAVKAVDAHGNESADARCEVRIGP